MEKIDYPEVDTGSAAEIIQRIQDAAAAEVKNVLARAEQEAAAVREAARQEVERKKQDALKGLRLEEEKLREKIFSTITLAKKRIILEAKNKIITDIFAKVRQIAVQFRKSREYADFLAEAVLEGTRVISTTQLTVLCAAEDEKVVNEVLLKNMKNKAVRLTLVKADFKDIGVLIQSGDGKMIYDNRFSARLKRIYDEVYMRLLREAV